MGQEIGGTYAAVGRGLEEKVKVVVKTFLAYALLIFLGFVLIPTIWGLINGIVLGSRVASDPAFQKDIATILTEEELKQLGNFRLDELPPEKRKAVESVVHDHLHGISWLPMHVASNLTTFAILGLAAGLLTGGSYWFVVPICLLPATMTLLNGPFIIGESWWVTIMLVLTVQFISAYSFAKTGAWILNLLRARK